MQISDSRMLNILSKPDKMQEFFEKERSILQEITIAQDRNEKLMEEFFSAKSLRGCQIKEMNVTGGGSNVSDLQSILESSESLRMEYIKGLQQSYKKLLQDIEEYQRVWACFHTLDERTQEIFTALYIQNEKWEWVKNQLKINHRELCKKRRKGIEEMKLLFENPLLSLAQISKMPGKKKQLTKNPVLDKGKQIKGQISIFDTLNNKEE